MAFWRSYVIDSGRVDRYRGEFRVSQRARNHDFCDSRYIRSDIVYDRDIGCAKIKKY